MSSLVQEDLAQLLLDLVQELSWTVVGAVIQADLPVV
jgi:hypothetical protein